MAHLYMMLGKFGAILWGWLPSVKHIAPKPVAFDREEEQNLRVQAMNLWQKWLSRPAREVIVYSVP